MQSELRASYGKDDVSSKVDHRPGVYLFSATSRCEIELAGSYTSMAIASMGSYSTGASNGMQSSSDTMVAMLAGPGCSTSPHHTLGGLQVVAPPLLVSGLEDTMTTTVVGQKRPYNSYDGATVEDGSGEFDGDDNGDELSPGSSHLEKKRRLTFDQVRSLERNFEMENKLEPERKMQLAKELGLRPRQVAVWFQNRRARWKTKQLERDYETLAADYEKLKAEYEQILNEKKQLKTEVQRLSGDGQQQANELSHRRSSTPTVDVSLTRCTTSSDVLDADSPRTTDSSSCPASSISDQPDQQHLVDHHNTTPENHNSTTTSTSFQCPGPESSSDFQLGDPSSAGIIMLTTDAVKLENSSGDGFHEFVDQSCNYLLLQSLDEQSVLPWWDWP